MKFYSFPPTLIAAATLFSIIDAAADEICFRPPLGWALADSAALSPNVKAPVIGPKTGMIPPSINLTTESFSGSLKDYVAIMKSISGKMGGTWKDLGAFKTAAGPANISQLINKTEWGDIQMLHVVLVKDGIVYILAAAALKEEFPSYYRQFYETFASLQFNESALSS